METYYYDENPDSDIRKSITANCLLIKKNTTKERIRTETMSLDNLYAQLDKIDCQLKIVRKEDCTIKKRKKDYTLKYRIVE